ncbi:MAG: winged helix-turn-helix transcriptional regulator [Anaerolineales bacterium]|nr:winged helix-turn-helix transcriptional regulator [Anaerolineales bacterium]
MDTFAVLADKTRRRIIELLGSRGQLSATEICAQFAVSAPAISQHLKLLREAGVVTMRKRGQQRLYQVNPAAFAPMETWLERLTQQVNERFDALDEVLAAEQRRTSGANPTE